MPPRLHYTTRQGRRYAPVVAVLGLAFASPAAYAGNGYETVTGTFGSPCESSPCPGGQFDEPTSIAVNDANEEAYVLDSGDDRIESFKLNAGKYEFEGQFNGDGEYETTGGVKHTGAKPPTGGFLKPGAIAIDNAPGSSHGDVYVADVGNDVIDEFSEAGKYEGQLTGTSAAGNGTLTKGSTRIEGVSTTSGAFIVGQEITGEGIPTGTTITAPPEAGVLEISQEATESKVAPLAAHTTFSGLLDVAVDPAGNIWVYEAEHGEVYEFSETGSFITAFHLHETFVPGFAVDSHGNVYINQVPPGGAEGGVIEYENGTGNALHTIASRLDSSVSLALIASTNDLLIDDVSTIELFRPPFGGEAPFSTFPTAGLSESDGIAVNGAEGEGILYATQRAADDVEFFSPGVAGKPEILSATAVSTSFEGGQFEAVINPNNRATTYSVEYSSEVSANGEELEGTITTIPGETTLLAEFGQAPVTLTGASFPETRGSYYYRVIATNNLGTETSKVEAYTKLPIVSEEAVLERTSTSATLEASVNPDYFETHYHFEYAESQAGLEHGAGTVIHGRNVGPGSPLEVCPESTVAGGTGTLIEGLNQRCPVAAEVTGLTPGHVYYYRVVAENGVSKHVGNANKGAPVAGTSEPLKPFAAPAVTTGEPEAITPTTATLFGEVNPEGASVTYVFAYITEAGYLKAEEEGAANPYAAGETTEPRALAASETTQPVGPVQASDLLPSTRYRYALIATNQYGTQTIGQYQTLKTTAATPPGAATGLATAIGQTSATLNGTVTTNGLATSYSFQVGTEPGVYGSPTGLGGVGGNTTQEVSTALTGLAPGTTYYYRLRATNSDGTTYGQPEPFTTAGLSYLLTVPAAALTAPIQAGQQNIEEHPAVNSGPSHLTNRQKLSKALTACRKGRKKTKRVKCERQARARYHVKKK